MEQVDFTIIGAGVVGLATAAQISSKGRDVFVIDKNTSFGQEASSRNSEVIHSGIYYPAQSLKRKLCIEGNRLLYEFCQSREIPFKKIGKLIMITEDSEQEHLHRLFNQGLENGLEDLKLLNKEEIRKLEPDIKGIEAIYSATTGIFDTHTLMEQFIKEAKAKGCEFVYSTEVVGIEKESAGFKVVVKDAQGEEFSFNTRILINSAGRDSDSVAGTCGLDVEKLNYSIKFCKGQYFRLSNTYDCSVKHLIYPMPDLEGVSLGTHITPDLAGSLRVGPDAHYVAKDNWNYDITPESKEDFYNSTKRFLANVEMDDLYPDTSGIRAKLQGSHEGFRDFIIKEESENDLPGLINLIGIDSPGLTSSISIARYVENLVGDM